MHNRNKYWKSHLYCIQPSSKKSKKARPIDLQSLFHLYFLKICYFLQKANDSPKKNSFTTSEARKYSRITETNIKRLSIYFHLRTAAKSYKTLLNRQSVQSGVEMGEKPGKRIQRNQKSGKGSENRGREYGI